MYASVTLSKAKKRRWYSKTSKALRNPKIIRGEVFQWREGIGDGNDTIHSRVRDPYIDGEEIPRFPRPSYILRVGESYRDDNGNPRSRQKHIYTFDEWAIIDELLTCEEHDWKHSPGRYIDAEWYAKQLKESFPDVDPWEFWPTIEEKLKPIEVRVLDEFKQSDEYRWWTKTLKLKKKLEAERDKQKAKEKKQQEEYRRQSYQQSYSNQLFPSSAGLSLSTEEADLIKRCYREMSKAVHPDKGGTDADMAMLNSLMDRLKAA